MKKDLYLNLLSCISISYFNYQCLIKWIQNSPFDSVSSQNLRKNLLQAQCFQSLRVLIQLIFSITHMDQNIYSVNGIIRSFSFFDDDSFEWSEGRLLNWTEFLQKIFKYMIWLFFCWCKSCLIQNLKPSWLHKLSKNIISVGDFHK